ncbi:MAG: PAS domain-containing protein, partial [Methanomicrobiales archaeon]|nr:PAS domain-containing protein [Methanomicrobiales archaeon]
MIDKPGRKALFTGPVVPGTAGQTRGHGAVVLPESIETALHAGLGGDDSARINLAGLPEEFRPLAVSINALLEKKEEEKQALKSRLAEANAFLKGSDTIIQQNPMPILIVDPQFKITLANAAYAEMSGIPIDQLSGKKISDFKIVSQKGSGLRQAMQEKKRISGEVAVELPSGTHILEQYGIPLLDRNDAIESILIVYNDVTRQREGEEEIRAQMENIAELQRQSETIVQKNPMPMLVIDTGMKILTANEAYLQLTGIDRSRITTMTLRDFRVHNQKGDGIKKMLTEKVRVYGEVTVEFTTGIYILEQYGIPLTNEKNELTGILITYNDVTEKRKEEDQIRNLTETANLEKEQLAQSARELGEALSAMAKGDLTAFVEAGADDPLHAVKNDYNASLTAMRALLADVA